MTEVPAEPALYREKRWHLAQPCPVDRPAALSVDVVNVETHRLMETVHRYWLRHLLRVTRGWSGVNPHFPRPG